MDKANYEGGPVHNGIMYCGIVPYLGIFQSDFTFLDEGSQTFSSPGAATPRAHRPQMARKCSLLLHQHRARELEKSQSFLFGNQEDQRVLVTFRARIFSILRVTSRFQAKTYLLHVVPQLRDSLLLLEKPTFDNDAKEEEALYKRSLEVCCSCFS
jgi:hypothetical protein